MNDLAKSVAETYRVFKPYRVGPDFSGCEHCVDPLKSAQLASTELGGLSLNDLDSYAFQAMTTWGQVNDFKHFLPRLLEIVAIEVPDAFLSVEVLFGKLRYARWTDWPTAERHAVKSYLNELWSKRLEKDVSSSDDTSIDTILCALACVCDSVIDFLAVWSERQDATSVRQLAQFAWINADTILKKNRLSNSFWENQLAMREVLNWITSAKVRNYLERGREHLADHLTYAPGQLDAIRATTRSIA